MTTLTFTPSKITPAEDPTERVWNSVASLAKDFEQAADSTNSVGRCVQLHERALACLQTLNDADELIRAKWDALLQEGLD